MHAVVYCTALRCAVMYEHALHHFLACTMQLYCLDGSVGDIGSCIGLSLSLVFLPPSLCLVSVHSTVHAILLHLLF